MLNPTLDDYNYDDIAQMPRWKKELGFKGEHEDYLAFQDAGLSGYLVKNNPMNSFNDWCKTIQKGCDFVFKIGRTIIKIESSSMGADYNYHAEYFKGSRLPRLTNPEYEAKPHGYKRNPFKIIRIWLVNGIEHMLNREKVQYYTSKFNVQLLNLTDTITLLHQHVNTITNSNNNTTNTIIPHIAVSSNSKELSDKAILMELKTVVKPSVTINHPCQVGHPDHEAWLRRMMERAEQYSQ